MLSPSDQATLDTAYKSSRTVWSALFAALFVYAGIAIQTGGGDQDKVSAEIFIMALAVVSVIQIPIAFLLRKMILSGKLGRMVKNDLDTLITRYRTAMIVALALFESVALYGFIIYLVVGHQAAAIAFGLVAAVLMLFIRPTREGLEGYVTSLLATDGSKAP